MVLSSDHACIIHGLCHSNNVSYVHAQAMTRYSQGRAFEYERIRFWREQGQYCMRSAGSKGAYDYLHLTPAGTVVLVQCKKVQTEAQAKKMITLFEANPPLPRGNFCQALEVLVIRKGLFFGWVDEAEDRPPVIEVDAAGVPTNW